MRVRDQLISGPSDVFRVLGKTMGLLEQESFRVILLNNKGRVICVKEVALGTVCSVEVHPRDVFREAIRKNCTSIVLVHNHPSGSTEESSEDVAITERLASAGELLGIRVLDHVIIAKDDYKSII